MSAWLEFTCVKVKQPIGTYYVGVMNMADLLEISYVDVRRRETSDTEIEKYIGIQRGLSQNRVKEIAQYVNLVDATFPTSIIVAVNGSDAVYNESTHLMRIKRDGNVAKILDGQHRVAGFEQADPRPEDFQSNVVLFLDMAIEDQAIVFATINKSQTKVNNSLVADLFAFAVSRSPQRTAHQIVRALNEKINGPFEGKIKILGVADDKERETITQATFVESLIKYISTDPMADRDLYKRGKKPAKVYGKDLDRTPFRNIFIDEEDAKIAQIVSNYFSAVALKWPIAWKEVRDDMILNKSTGFVALMRFLRDVYQSFPKTTEVPTTDAFRLVFDKITIREEDFTRQKYIPGQSGISDLYKQLKSQSGLA